MYTDMTPGGSQSKALSMEDIRRAADAAEVLGKVATDERPLTLSAEDGSAVELPGEAARLLVLMLKELGQGRTVSMLTDDDELTTQQVADLLRVSRPWVVKEIEEGRLPARAVGTHRRVRVGDFVAYQQRFDAKRKAALDRLWELNEKYGLE